MMEQSVKDRLRLFLRDSNIKAIDFCKSIEVSSGFISGMRESVQPDKLKSIAIKYPDLSIGWLMTGIGDMLVRDKPASPNYQSGDRSINANYQGHFNEPINTVIGNTLSGSGSLIKNNDRKVSKPTKATIPGEDSYKEKYLELQERYSSLERRYSALEEKCETLREFNNQLQKSLIEEKDRLIKTLLDRG